jgi:hypothetical protein
MNIAVQRPWTRVVAALFVASVMLVAVSFAVAVWLTAPLAAMDTGDLHTGEGQARVALALATVLFVGTGPVAYWIGRRRGLLAIPAIVAAVYGLGVVIASVT